MDELTIRKIRDGDQASFKVVYDQQIDKALRVASAITKNHEFAKDAVQETFIRVFRNINSYDPSMPFEPWFYRILMNECNRIMKKESKSFSFDHTSYEFQNKHKEENPEDYSDLYQAIQSLKDSYRIPLILKYLKGFSEKEIAETMDLNQNTVKSRLFKGREKFKKAFEQIKRREQHV